MANKHTIIVIASIIVIMASLGYSSLNLVSAKDLQFRWNKIGAFDFIAILVRGNLVVCNNSDLPSSFQSYSFSITYDGKDLGTFVTEGGMIAPHTTGIISGKLQSDDKKISETFFSFLDTELGGTDVTRIDATKMAVTSTLDTRIIGIIPHTITHQYSGQEFMDMMNQKTSCDK